MRVRDGENGTENRSTNFQSAIVKAYDDAADYLCALKRSYLAVRAGQERKETRIIL